MKGNNRGFTLIELLAAITILAVLMVFGIPAIIGLLDSSKSKVYVSDAKKLIAQAQYVVKAKSSVIEQPEDGDCILISLLYLESSDFDNPPGDGEYLKENSYVVVKNKGGNLEYSAILIEKMKNGSYRGVELSKEKTLLSKYAKKHVIYFEEDDILNVETDVNRGYINDKLGVNYMSSDNTISAIYNYPELMDNSSTIGSPEVPKIVFASLLSSSSRGFNTLESTLQLKVEDKDTPKSDLNVYISVGGGYDKATTPIPYGNNDVFSYDINFAEYGGTYDGTGVKIYVVVKDPDGNTAKKTLIYKIHKNLPPEIDDASGVTRRDQDVYHGIGLNMLTAKVTMILADDIDDYSGLSVCFKESPTNENITTCDDYHSYYSYFSEDNVMEYLFTNCAGGRCKRDGTTHYLTFFIKDSLGAITKKRYSYEFSVNKAPKIKSLSIRSKGTACIKSAECPVAEYGGNKTIIVKADVEDDVDPDNQMIVRIYDGIWSSPHTYLGPTGEYNHNIKSPYDGSTKTIEITVLDTEEGYTSEYKTYKLYLNKPPVINSFSVESKGTACINESLCPVDEYGGSKKTIVTLDVIDDVDYDNLNVCLANENGGCNDFSFYSNFNNKKKIIEIPHIYDGSNQTIYVLVRDSDGAIDTSEYGPYKLYTNIPPVLDFALFNPITDGRPTTNNLNAILSISGRDDVDNSSNLRFQIIEDGVVTLDNAKLSSYMGKDRVIRLNGIYDGRTRNIKVRLIDTDGATVDSETQEYEVYEGAPPTIELFNVYSKEIACRDDLYCPLEDDGNYNVKYIVKAKDDIDIESELGICVSESSTTCDNYSYYSNYLVGENPKEMSYSFNVDANLPYDGSTKTLYLYVKDTDGNITKQSVEYTLYKNKAPVVTEDPRITNMNDINLPEIVYSIGVDDDLDESLQIKYCYRKEGVSEYCTNYKNYKQAVTLNNTFFNVDVPAGQVYTIYSKIKDSYGKETTSKELTYKIYDDINPVIHQSNIGSGRRIYKNILGEELETLEGVSEPEQYNAYTRLKINFSVDDPYDNYSVCVSSDPSTCTSYGETTYEANNCSGDNCTNIRRMYSVLYDQPGFIEDGNNFNLYLFIKDSYNKVSTAVLYSDKYTLCADESEDTSYEYELINSENNHPISIDRCAGKCYHYDTHNNTVNNIKALYTKKITYFDKLNSHIACNSENPEEEEYEAYCDFKDCFYKNNNYVRNAIGTRLYVDDIPWTIRINDTIYNCTGHYNLYVTSYDTGNKNILLEKTNTKICNNALANGEYNYDSTADNPFIRVDD